MPLSWRTRRETRLTRTLGFPTFSRAFLVSSAFNVFPHVPFDPKGRKPCLVKMPESIRKCKKGINYAISQGRSLKPVWLLNRKGFCYSSLYEADVFEFLFGCEPSFHWLQQEGIKQNARYRQQQQR